MTLSNSSIIRLIEKFIIQISYLIFFADNTFFKYILWLQEEGRPQGINIG